ncbi:Ada metal-binding domain-containing protein [Cronobacter sakazakii]|nr:Ada metal-binding domain-containing protein [Cronobacter sakazakii]
MNVADFTSEHARWQAVESRDARADNAFVFAVVTTGIFCRPSCRARRPLRENVRFLRRCQRRQRGRFSPLQTLPAGRAHAAGAKSAAYRGGLSADGTERHAADAGSTCRKRRYEPVSFSS